MAAIESNLVLKTSVPKPTSLTGFRDIKNALKDIKSDLQTITAKPWTIKVGLDLTGIPSLKKLLKAAGLAQGAAPQAGGGLGGTGSGSLGSSGGVTDLERIKETFKRDKKTGGFTLFSRKETEREATDKADVDRTTTFNKKGVATKQVVDTKKLPGSFGINQAFDDFVTRQSSLGRAVNSETVASGTDKYGRKSFSERFTAVTESFTNSKGQVVELKRAVLDVNTATGKTREYTQKNVEGYREQKRELDAAAREQQRIADLTQRTNAYYVERNRLLAAGAKLLNEVVTVNAKGEQTRSSQFTTTDATGKESITTVSNRARDAARVKDREDPLIRSQRKFDAAQNARNQAFQKQANAALAEGFEAKTPIVTQRLDKFGRSLTTVSQEFAKTAQVGLGRYVVTLRKIDEATGQMRERTLEGGAAIRYMGDTFLTAVGKVQLWTAATSAIFLAIQAMKEAYNAASQLEEGTALLARVGSNLIKVEDGIHTEFKDRVVVARELTSEILKLATATGADSIAAQRAASVFARAGQDRQQILQSVKASLLAAKIAELDVEEAANLLSAAMLQFNLTAKDLLPTLDTLNELSNHYRVTTDDLLQSISRTGAVVEAQGGRLSELAAITAIVSQSTSRSGAEIGNAIKTISSRIVSPEVASSIEDIGVSLRNTDGSSRSLSEVLLELRNAFANLTESERDQLTVSIAGVRQRNILIAAVNGSVDSILAEIKALREAGSAEKEFTDTSTTISSAVQRLTNSLIKLVSEGGAPVTNTLRGIINILQGFVAILNSGVGKVITSAILFGGAMYAMSRATGSLGLSTASSGKSLAYMAGRAIGLATSMNVSKVSSYASSIKAAGLNAISAAGGFLKAHLANAVLTAGLYVAIDVIGRYAQRQATLGAAIENDIARTEKVVSVKEKEAKATQIAAKAIFQQIEAIQKISKSGDGNAKDRVSSLKEEIQRIAKAAGINIPLTFDFANPKAIENALEIINRKAAQDAEAKATALKEKNNSLFNSKDLNIDKLADAEFKLSVRRKAAANPNGLAAGIRSLGLGEKYATFSPSEVIAPSEIDNNNAIRELELQASGFRSEIEKANAEIAKTRTEIKSLEETAGALKAPNNEFAKLQASLLGALSAAEELKKAMAIRKELSGAFGVDEVATVNKDYEDQLKILTSIDNELANYEAHGAANKALVEETSKKWAEQKEEVEKVAIAAAKIKISRDVKDLLDDKKGISSLVTARDVSRGRAGRNSNLNGISGLLDLEVERNSILTQANAISQSPASGGLQAAAKRQQLQELFTSLKEKELELARQVYETETKIAEERKKSADEVQRALGGLNDEDKIRFRATLKFFEKNPNEQISTSDLLANDSNNNRIIEQFFANRIKPSDPNAGGLDARIAATVRTPEQVAIEAQQKELDRLRQGGTSDEFADAQVQGSRAANDRLRRLDGQDPLNYGDSNTVEAAPNISVTIAQDAGRMEALVDAFQEAATAEMGQMEARLVKQINDIWAKLRAKPPSRFPTDHDPGQ